MSSWTLRWGRAGDWIKCGTGHLWCRNHLARSICGGGRRRRFTGSAQWGCRRGRVVKSFVGSAHWGYMNEWEFTVTITGIIFIYVLHGSRGNATKFPKVGRVPHDGSTILSVSSDHAAMFGCDNEGFGRKGGSQFVFSLLFHQNMIAWLQITGFCVTLLICVRRHSLSGRHVVATDLDRYRDWEVLNIMREAR